jgi:hypothetical protein
MLSEVFQEKRYHLRFEVIGIVLGKQLCIGIEQSPPASSSISMLFHWFERFSLP